MMRWRWFGAVLCLVLAVGCQRGGTFLEQLGEFRARSADMRLEFVRANDASNRAVMADTDEASSAFAEEARRAVRAIDDDAAKLEPRVHALALTDEERVLADFRQRFAAYRAVDDRVLALAVENTNLKAQRLSFGPLKEAADAFKGALDAIVRTTPAPRRCEADALAARATIAVREIQIMQAAHIAEPNDTAMTRMETDMAALRTSAKDAVTALGAILPSQGAAALLDRFDALSAELVGLSRRNTNVVSLDLSLRIKPALASACEESLRALQDAWAKRGRATTR